MTPEYTGDDSTLFFVATRVATTPYAATAATALHSAPLREIFSMPLHTLPRRHVTLIRWLLMPRRAPLLSALRLRHACHDAATLLRHTRLLLMVFRYAIRDDTRVLLAMLMFAIYAPLPMIAPLAATITFFAMLMFSYAAFAFYAIC